MKCYFSSIMKTGLLKSIVCAGLACVSLTSVAQADAAAENILKRTRYAATLQQQDLHGHMNKDGRKTPVTLFMRGENIQFAYGSGKASKRFHMRLELDEVDLFDIVGGKTKKFNSRQIAENINGTDLSFEDLSMRFLYWKNSQIMGEDRISGQKCHIIRLINPGTSGDYKQVYVYVHQKYGSLMRVIGYSASGQPLKQFQVTDLMKVGKEYTLKRMRVDRFNPKTNKSIGVTYLEFDKPKKAAKAGR